MSNDIEIDENEIELIFGYDQKGNEIKRSAYTNNADIQNAAKNAKRINSDLNFDDIIEEIDMSVPVNSEMGIKTKTKSKVKYE